MLDRFTYVDDMIEDMKFEEIAYRTLHTKAHISKENLTKDIVVPYLSLTNKYKDFLKQIIIELPLDDDEAQIYHLKPKLLSEHLYGTTELWYSILELNGLKSIIEFDLKNIKVYDPTRIKDYINEILILEGVIK